jgi:hypothetical protein
VQLLLESPSGWIFWNTLMSMRTIVRSTLLTAVFCPIALLCQQKADQPKEIHAPPIASATQEFPVTMRQNIIAGKTPVGTKVEARLAIATLMAGKVIPEGAIFSGVVVVSVARSESSPSRLSVRMNSVQWKKDSAPVTAYLTSWYYPVRMPGNDDATGDPLGGIHGDIGIQRGAGPRPGPGTSQPYPTNPQQGPDLPSAPVSNLSDHRVEMKDIESERASDGTMSIRSSRLNIKLDRSTTYVLATGDLVAGK